MWSVWVLFPGHQKVFHMRLGHWPGGGLICLHTFWALASSRWSSSCVRRIVTAGAGWGWQKELPLQPAREKHACKSTTFVPHAQITLSMAVWVLNLLLLSQLQPQRWRFSFAIIYWPGRGSSSSERPPCVVSLLAWDPFSVSDPSPTSYYEVL